MIMKKFIVSIVLTDDEVNLLKEIVLKDGIETEIPSNKLVIVDSLEMKGLLIKGSRLDETSMFMTAVGLDILKLI